MFPSHALVGLAVGLAFAVLDYLVLLPLMMRPMRGAAEQATGAERVAAERRLGLVRNLFLWQFVGFPIAGYIVARMVWG